MPILGIDSGSPVPVIDSALVSTVEPIASDQTVQPVSLTQRGRLRTDSEDLALRKLAEQLLLETQEQTMLQLCGNYGFEQR